MAEAARRMGLKTAAGARRSLANSGVSLEKIHARAYAVDEDVLAAHIAANGPFGPGRPWPVKNEPGAPTE